MELNSQLQLASDYLHYTGKNIFLTGKAGTGKTTFLRQIRKTIQKRVVIVAPTGVAAINAGGSTIHSFFQIPFGPFIPDETVNQQRSYQFGKEKIRLIKSIDVLVIDEISMVRADTLDSIDRVLRQYKDSYKPFGGVQLLMIGDLFQLSPVIKDEEWQLLRPYYDNVFFFNSRALRLTEPITIELTHIYRQADQVFINLLNKIRENNLDVSSLKNLNERYIPDFDTENQEGYITLTTHNANAQTINTTHLNNLKGEIWSFNAETSGDFPVSSYPTEAELILKKGAQVMFIKNDVSADKLFYNGKIGVITHISDEGISVRCEGHYVDIEVAKATWYNTKYLLNPETKEIEEQIIGQFEQYPLKLAWAITIHKSQGLTFEKVIIDAGDSFAHGQVYVALSRCKSLEGLVLSSKLKTNSIKTDFTVSRYSEEESKRQPDENHLLLSKIEYQKTLILDLFDFREIQRSLNYLLKILEENATIIMPDTLSKIREMKPRFEKEILDVSNRFSRELNRHLNTGQLVEENEIVKERISKATAYFLPNIEVILESQLQQIIMDTDNSTLQKSLTRAKETLAKAIFVKTHCLLASQNSFQIDSYLRIKYNSDIDFKSKTDQEETFNKNDSSDLYEALKSWRNHIAAENNVLDYMVMPMKVISEIVKVRPTNLSELAKIKGIGKTKVKQYGLEILEILVSHTD